MEDGRNNGPSSKDVLGFSFLICHGKWSITATSTFPVPCQWFLAIWPSQATRQGCPTCAISRAWVVAFSGNSSPSLNLTKAAASIPDQKYEVFLHIYHLLVMAKQRPKFLHTSQVFLSLNCKQKKDISAAGPPEVRYNLSEKQPPATSPRIRTQDLAE